MNVEYEILLNGLKTLADMSGPMKGKRRIQVAYAIHDEANAAKKFCLNGFSSKFLMSHLVCGVIRQAWARLLCSVYWIWWNWEWKQQQLQCQSIMPNRSCRTSCFESQFCSRTCSQVPDPRNRSWYNWVLKSVKFALPIEFCCNLMKLF